MTPRRPPPGFDFYFDFVSPYGWFASLRVNELAARHGRRAEWHVMLLGVSVVKVMGLKPLLETPLKRDYLVRECQRYVRRHGWSPQRPFDRPPDNPLPAARTFAWLKRHAPELAQPVAAALYAHYWMQDRAYDIDSAVAIAAAHGADAARLRAALEDGEAAALLRQNVEASLARGVFGSPTLIVDGEPFWGVDKLEQVEDWLARGGW